MKRSLFSLTALLLAVSMLALPLASCNEGKEQDSSAAKETETATEVVSTPNDSTEASSPGESETDSETDTEIAGTDSETAPPATLEGTPNGELIENANALANGVNAYFTDGKRTDFALENQNMTLKYALANCYDQQITSLVNKDGKAYITDTADVFVKMKSGNVFYASSSTASATANLYRMGYYMYEARFEEQNFLSKPIDEDAIVISTTGAKRNQVKISSSADGSMHVELTNSEDPFVELQKINYSADDYPYLLLTLKADIISARGITVYLAAGSYTSLGSQTKTVIVAPTDEYVTYVIPLYQIKGYEGQLTKLRLDFAGKKQESYDIKEIKLMKGNIQDTPNALGLNRSFFVYSDKLHHVLQIATADTATENIDSIGMETRIAADTVAKLIVKDKSGTHTSLENVDWASAEYVGFDIKEAGIFGYILPNDPTSGSLTVTLSDGYYTIIQSRAPQNGTILPSGKKNTSTGKIEPLVSENGNDFFMGQRLYTDATHDFDTFLKEAEAERNPLGAESFVIDEAASTEGKFAKYNALRGIYELNLASDGFNAPFFMYPNKHYGVRFTVKGDETDRRIYVMAASSSGSLECAVLLDENDMLLPVPVEVGKNFSEANGERNRWNIEDSLYNEAIIPMVIRANSKGTYNFLNLYQNWGQFPLKQVSWIQYSSPYYHLSTGVTETNCIVPYYSCKNSRGLNTLPDHRAMSAPYWAGQPQHNSGGSHIWLVYTDAEGFYSASENTLNTIDSYGPTYADVTMQFMSDDGNIKVTYTHTEFPQTDENRAYYEMRYEILGDVSFKNFSEDFHFYKVCSNDPTGLYQNLGYLNAENEPVIVDTAKSGEKIRYVLGDKCPYFSYFNMTNYTSTSAEGYTNLSFLVCNSEFVIGGQKVDPRFLIINDEQYVRVSLDLEEVTLKKGDSFIINCIVMPWGSQESVYDSKEFAGDQNVRDVRENSLLNPLTAKAVADCTVLESAFVPKLETTNGKSATFTLTGGHNNVAVRVYGFEKLTNPVIEELVDGKWVAHQLSSAYTPDAQGNGHYYDGYSVYYDGNGEFSYSFVVEMDYADKDGRTFRITASEDFKAWPKELPEIEKEDVELPLNVYVTAEEISKNAGMGGMFGGVEFNKAGNFTRLNTKAGAAESYFTAYPGGTVTTGQYFVIKYRIPTDNTAKISSFEVFTNTTGESASYAGCYGIGSYLKADGEWHLLTVDLASYGKSTFVPAADGTYKVSFIRLDPFNDSRPAGTRIDIAFVGMSDNPENAYKLGLDLQTVEFVSCKNGSSVLVSVDPVTGLEKEADSEESEEESEVETEAPPATGDATSSKEYFNVYLNATSIIKAAQANGTGHLGDEELLETGNVARIHYCTEGDPTAARRLESYFYLYKSTDGLATGQYFVLKYRAPEQIGYIQLYAGTNSDSAGKGGVFSLEGPSHATKPLFIADGEWHIVVIDLSKAMSGFTADAGGKFTAKHLRLDLFNFDRALEDGKTTYVDIEYAALCDDYTEILGKDASVSEILFYNGEATEKIANH